MLFERMPEATGFWFCGLGFRAFRALNSCRVSGFFFGGGGGGGFRTLRRCRFSGFRFFWDFRAQKCTL